MIHGIHPKTAQQGSTLSLPSAIALSKRTRLFLLLAFYLFLALPITSWVRADNLRALMADPSPSQWRELSHFDSTLTRRQFESSLGNVFDPFHGLRPFLRISDQGVTILAKANDPTTALVSISFRPDTGSASSSYRSPEIVRASHSFWGRALSGVRIAVDPADIGGSWGNKEDRSTYYPQFGLIQEGDLNRLVGLELKKRLTDLGAKVFLVRDESVPVGDFSADDVSFEVNDILRNRRYLLPPSFFQRVGSLSPSSPRYREIAYEALITKTFEARARAEKVRDSFKADLTLVLQHDASPNSRHGGFVSSNRNIFFVEGAYTSAEVSKDPGQRLHLLTKLFEQVTPIEVEVADQIARAFKYATGFPPVGYGNSSTTRAVVADPYVVARNLALNREHDGPVVVTEPYFMNNPLTLRRLLAGDYDGERVINGKSYKSIYQEYADAVCDGLVKCYGSRGGI